MASNDTQIHRRPPDLPPQPQPPGPGPSSSPRSRNPSALDLNKSNSTAKYFLGNARKSWMSMIKSSTKSASTITTSSAPAPAPAPAPPRIPPPLAAAAPVAPVAPPPPPPSRGSSPVDCPSAPSPPVAAVSSPPSRSVGMPSSLPTLPSIQQSLALLNDNTATVASPTATAPQNVRPPPPPMPSASDTPPSLTRSPASNPQSDLPRGGQLMNFVDARLQQRHKQQLQQSQLQAHLQRQSASSLPSPDPTIPPRSHTSPSTVIEGNGSLIPSPSVAALPSPPQQQAPPARRGRPRKNPSSIGVGSVPPSSNRQERNSIPAAVHQGHARPEVYPSLSNSRPTPIAPLQPPLQPQTTTLPNGQSLAIDDDFFMRAKIALEATSRHMSDSVEAPRMQLLIYACTEQDIFYLALHQVYCMSSYAPSQFHALPGISPKLLKGLEIVQHLLVENTKVSGDFLKWCMEFPCPISMLLQVRKYQDAYSHVLRVLVILADRWSLFEHNVKNSKHPPLVDFMVRALEVVSPVLQYSIWLCLCRRLPNVRVEGPLQDIFMQNVDITKRYMKGQINDEQRRIESDRIAFLYDRTIAKMGQVEPPRREAAPGAAQSLRLPSSSQAALAPLPAPATPATTHITLPTPVRPYSPAHAPTGIVPTSTRSPHVSGPPRARPQGTLQIQTQQRAVGPQGLLSPVTAVISSPLIATTRSPLSQPVSSQASPIQQHSQHLQQARTQMPRTSQQQPRPLQIPASHLIPAANPQYPQQRRPATLLLPPPNVPPVINTRPNPNRLAIHQAYLRDPVNQFVSVDATGQKDTELLPHVTSFIVDPEPLCPPKRAFKWLFDLTEWQLKHRPLHQPQGLGQRIHRFFKEGDQNFRLRCIKVPRSTTKVSEDAWCVAETVWPCAIYMSVNDLEVFPRRKLHNGRDLPLDITTALREGLNSITIHFILGPAELKEFTYAMALEVLTFTTPANAKTLIQHLPAAESRERIRERLARNSSTEDDELCIVSDDLRVSLVDPYTARLFVVPVRGRQCEHLECFDHETFIQTHALKSGDRSALEADWRCPICRQDARPQSLVVDEFLAEVRSELERTNRCDGARTLQIKADGAWEVQTEDDVQSSSKGASQLPPSALKRQASAMDSGSNKRPKVDRSTSIPGDVTGQPAEVITLD